MFDLFNDLRYRLLNMNGYSTEAIGAARQEVRQLAASDHLLELAQEALPAEASYGPTLVNTGYRLLGLLGLVSPADQKLDADRLKKLEYAMLIAPISKGIEGFLEDPTAPFPAKARRLSGFRLTGGVAKAITANVEEALRDTPELDVLKKLASARASQMGSNRAHSVTPFKRTVKRAALSSAIVMRETVDTNGLAIWRATRARMSHEDLVSRVRASHSLALAQPVMHLDFNIRTLDAIGRYRRALIDGRLPPQAVLKYDQEREVAHTLGRPKEWQTADGLPVGYMLRPAADVEIGCPLSFSQALVRGYYESMVDLVERYQAWPKIMKPRAQDATAFK